MTQDDNVWNNNQRSEKYNACQTTTGNELPWKQGDE